MLTELEEILDEEELPWYFEIEQYCKDGTYPEGASTEDRRAIRRAALRYTVVGEVLYRRALNGVLLRCLLMMKLGKWWKGPMLANGEGTSIVKCSQRKSLGRATTGQP
ncbi:hypothetical protein Taro_017589 [Colocasia esculenta]|uniref:Uncharacterized protein n=1 Tax=Colocasia esculenta TaxID=4460 RepID=A0A843UP13_COLES|nr:hypothetical protein [Colocasia esculenta]